MYIWLVLSTFLAILAGYSLPMRSDTPEKMNVPVASAHMMKMVIQHRSAQNFIKKHRWPYWCADVTSGVTSCDEKDRIGFGPGEIDWEDIKQYVPDGFLVDAGTEGTGYKSHIFCYNPDETPVDNCEESEGSSKIKYLVTYGDLHEKWLASQTLDSTGDDEKALVTPSDDMMRAFRNQFGYGEMAGYIREFEETQEIINYQGVSKFTLPEDMWDELSSSCTYNGSCIAYVSVL